jgi:hypothetical protein
MLCVWHTICMAIRSTFPSTPSSNSSIYPSFRPCQRFLPIVAGLSLAAARAWGLAGLSLPPSLSSSLSSSLPPSLPPSLSLSPSPFSLSLPSSLPRSLPRFLAPFPRPSLPRSFSLSLFLSLSLTDPEAAGARLRGRAQHRIPPRLRLRGYPHPHTHFIHPGAPRGATKPFSHAASASDQGDVSGRRGAGIDGPSRPSLTREIRPLRITEDNLQRRLRGGQDHQNSEEDRIIRTQGRVEPSEVRGGQDHRNAEDTIIRPQRRVGPSLCRITSGADQKLCGLPACRMAS